MKACPKCKSTSRDRVKRKSIVKLFPGSRAYSCNKCSAYYAWFPMINRSIRI